MLMSPARTTRRGQRSRRCARLDCGMICVSGSGLILSAHERAADSNREIDEFAQEILRRHGDIAQFIEIGGPFDRAFDDTELRAFSALPLAQFFGEEEGGIKQESGMRSRQDLESLTRTHCAELRYSIAAEMHELTIVIVEELGPVRHFEHRNASRAKRAIAMGERSLVRLDMFEN